MPANCVRERIASKCKHNDFLSLTSNREKVVAAMKKIASRSHSLRNWRELVSQYELRFPQLMILNFRSALSIDGGHCPWSGRPTPPRASSSTLSPIIRPSHHYRVVAACVLLLAGRASFFSCLIAAGLALTWSNHFPTSKFVRNVILILRGEK